ncbi:MAG: hypothetical protein HY901_35675 [Deltaproteobacteria bacterium]|nr:hypothetical protein [Deltaproteobacteria bacterium]
MKTPALCLVALLVVPAAGCGPSAYDRARREDSIEAWSGFLREVPADRQAPEARRRLAELEFLHARRQNTILAYKRFLETHPESERRSDAAVLLEGLRFEVASGADTSHAWNEFLRDHPAGAHASKARARLDQADHREAVNAGTSQALELYLARHPETEHRLEVERLLDDRRFAEAQGAGPRALAAYLDTSSAGAYREEARAALAAHEASARAWLGQFEAARRAAEQMPEGPARTKTLAEVGAAELDQLTARLDPHLLEGFAGVHPGPIGDEARSRARALARDRSGTLKALARRLEPSRFARPQSELVRVLAATDPRDRWIAAEELGRIGSIEVAEPLLESAAGSRFSRVRQRAFAALLALFAAVPSEVRELEVRGRLEALRRVAQTPALQVKLALLEELLGEDAKASANYQKCVSSDAADLFVARRLTLLRIRRGEGFGAAVAARELAIRVQQLVEQRAQQEGLSPALLARTLCGARDEAQAAVETLQGLPAQVARDFPDDLQAFTRRAMEALRLVSARLSDAEVEARRTDRGFKGCDEEGDFRERLADGEADRLKVVNELLARREPLIRHALALAARHDPSPSVREAAKAGLVSLEVGR